MKRSVLFIVLFLSVIIFTKTNVQAQYQSSDFSVQVSAEVQSNPPQIRLKWSADPNAINYVISRKDKEDATWGNKIGTVTGAKATEFLDTNVEVGLGYEYRLVKNAKSGTTANYTGFGYIYAGINLTAIETKGTIILLVDDRFTTSLSAELARLQQDIVGDGWNVIRHDVSTTTKVPMVKDLILADYNADPGSVQAVFLFGHIPVPYSGLLNPDGHPDHYGAWAADVYYGDMFGTWTDTQANSTTASRSANKNIPGDGKFDPTLLPAAVFLEIGRVDLYDMPQFAPRTEKDLLKQYLDKDHNFRQKQFTAERRAIIDDNFGAMGGEAFASSGWRNFAPMFGADSVQAGKYFDVLGKKSCLWSYGCGGGNYSGASGVGSTSNFTTASVQTVFTMLFGSYFGDWDVQNSFLRAPLASSPYCLTNCWSGRPYWHFHHMALGENIGYSARLTQNNSSMYASNYAAHWVHIALMGDPTLRMYIVAPPKNATAVAQKDYPIASISWTKSADSVLGYYVYRSEKSNGNFTRISDLLQQSNFTDTASVKLGDTKKFFYLVRAVKLEKSGSGTYYNLSQGSFADSLFLTGIAENADVSAFQIFPNPASERFSVQFSATIFGNATLKIFDALGREIFVKNLVIESENLGTDVNIAGLARGMYVVEVKSDGKTFRQNFMKD